MVGACPEGTEEEESHLALAAKQAGTPQASMGPGPQLLRKVPFYTSF